jgi:hypothetical protein
MTIILHSFRFPLENKKGGQKRLLFVFISMPYADNTFHAHFKIMIYMAIFLKMADPPLRAGSLMNKAFTIAPDFKIALPFFLPPPTRISYLYLTHVV